MSKSAVLSDFRISGSESKTNKGGTGGFQRQIFWWHVGYEQVCCWKAQWVIGCRLPAPQFWFKSPQIVTRIFAFGFSCKFLTCLHLLVSRLRCLLVRSALNWDWFILAILQLCIIMISFNYIIGGYRRIPPPRLHFLFKGLLTDLFLSPPHCRLVATWTCLLQFVFTFPQWIKSQNSQAKNETPRWWKLLSQAKPRSRWS